MTESEFAKLKKACRKLPPGPDYRDREYVVCLLTTVLDFQMKVETVEAALKHFRLKHGKSIRTDSDLRGFLRSYAADEPGNKEAAQALWGNNCWTRLGFLRALVEYLGAEAEVSDFATLRAWADATDFKSQVDGRIRYRHHGVGPVIFQWLRLRTGASTVKMDVWVVRFVAGVLDPAPRNDEAREALVRIAEELGRKAHELDAAIWHKMRD